MHALRSYTRLGYLQQILPVDYSSSTEERI